MLAYSIIVLVALLNLIRSYDVAYDSRSFLINNERVLLISGSIHYPRMSSAEWPAVISKAKENGLNTVETYVFWDIHEPKEGQYYFPDDPENSDNLIGFLNECQKQNMFVNLRFGPYVCAEWNYGGFPAWLREKDGIVFRSTDPLFTERMVAFVDKTMEVVSEAKMLATDGGPVAMLQIENEFGNMEHFYPKTGADYVQWAAQYAEQLTAKMNVSIPWMMCQQGEGVGTAPPASVINTCNGYYCDNWIEQHSIDFPNQPHLWTENWPGWYQKWGEAVPHRPAVDVAFSVARWYAKGGTFMNYYMVFGGTSFGRHVGGPLIITSYDYDVQINEYGLHAEPKFTLLQRLHNALMEVAPILLAHDEIPTPQGNVQPMDSCEVHHYDQHSEEVGCVSFYSNYGTDGDCVFKDDKISLIVSAWSVSIVADACTSPKVLFNSRESGADIPSNRISTAHLNGAALSPFKVFTELVPSSPEFAEYGDVAVTKAEHPLDQLSTTQDTTDYMWLSTTVPLNSSTERAAKLRYLSAMSGGPVAYVYVDGELQDSTVSLDDTNQPSDFITNATYDANKAAAGYANHIEDPTIGFPIRMDIQLPAADSIKQECSIDLLAMSMGLKNYGPHLEKIRIGVVSDLEVDDVVLSNYNHVVGLQGERLELYNEYLDAETLALFKDFDATTQSKPLSWYRSTFKTPADVLLAADRIAKRAETIVAVANAVAESATAIASAVNAVTESAAKLGELSRSTKSDSYPALALDISKSKLRKGAVWVNGMMLGRYWNLEVDQAATCQAAEECDWRNYSGPYSAGQCRTGCGGFSQQLYKIPGGLLHTNRDDAINSIVFMDEIGGDPEGVEIVEVTMVNE